MENLCKHENFFVTHGVAIAVQVTMIFTFLTIFFFAYVVKTEKDEFESQISFIVDRLVTEKAIQPYIEKLETKISKKDLETMILGVLETTKRNSVSSASGADKDIADQNKKVYEKAFRFLQYAWGCLILGIIVLLIFGVCTPLWQTFKESLLIVLFVGLTEFVFLKYIASKYISSSPNAVKKDIAVAVQQWIADNKKI